MDSYVFELSDVSINNGSDTLTINNSDSVFGAIPGSMLWIDNYRPRYVLSVDNTARTVTLTTNWNGDDVISQSATIAPIPAFADHQKAVDAINSAKTSVDNLIERYNQQYDVETASELAGLQLSDKDVGLRARCRSRADANYILEPAIYVAKVGDIPTANGYTWRLFITDRRNVNLRQFGVIPGDRNSGTACMRAAIDLLIPLGSSVIVIPDFGDDLSSPPNTLMTNAMIEMPTFITVTGETMRARWWVDFDHDDADFPLIPFRGINEKQNVRIAVLHGMIWNAETGELEPHPAQDGEIQTGKRIYKPQFTNFEMRAWEGSGLYTDTMGFVTGVGLRSQSTRTADFINCSIRGFACKIAHTEVFSDVAKIENCVLTSYSSDLRNLATIMLGFGEVTYDGETLNPSNGDCCVIERCQFGFSDGSAIPHIAAVSRTNLQVIANVNPSLYAYRCTMTRFADNKLETGWVTIDGPNSIISNNEMANYAEPDALDAVPSPVTLMNSNAVELNGESTQPIHILQINAFQRRTTDFRGGSSLRADVLIDTSVRAEIHECYQNVGSRIGSQKLGIKVRRLDGVTPIGDWDALSHLYSTRSTILANQGIQCDAGIDVSQNDTDVFKNRFPGFGIAEDGRNNAMLWNAAPGTYFYKFQVLLDANVGIGVTLETSQSIEKLVGSNASILEYRDSPSGRDHAFENVILRVYRGSAEDQYDAVANIACIAIRNIWDYGDRIATSVWTSRTAGPVDNIIEMEGDASSKFFGYKLNGDGTKTLTGGLGAKRLSLPTVHVLKEERQFAIGVPEFLTIVTHDVNDKTRSGHEFKMLRSGDFIASSWEPGDYLVSNSIRVTSDGSVWHYDTAGTTGAEEPTTVGADGTANIDALLSTNGVYYRAVNSGLGEINQTILVSNNEERASNIVAVVGTSLVEQCERFVAPHQAHSTKSWIEWAAVFTHQRFSVPTWHDPTVVEGWEPKGVAGDTRNYWGLNMGVAGQTSTQILDRNPRSLSDAVKANAGWVIINAGTNDINNTSKEDIQANRESLCNFYLGAGFNVLLLPILARDTGSWPAGSVQRSKANWINKKSRLFVEKTINLFTLDWNDPWVDFTLLDAVPKAGFSHDGVHMTAMSAFYIGKLVAEFFNAVLPPPDRHYFAPDDFYDTTDNPYGNLVYNPYLTGTTGTNADGSSGTVATGFRMQRILGDTSTVTASKVTRADGFGDWQQLAITVTDAATLAFRNDPVDMPIFSALQDKWVVLECDVEVEAYSGYKNVQAWLQDVDGSNGGIAISQHSVGFNNEGPIPDESWTGKLRTPPLRLSVDTTLLRVQMLVEVDGTPTAPGEPALVRFGAIHCYPVDDPRVTYGIGHDDQGNVI